MYPIRKPCTSELLSSIMVSLYHINAIYSSKKSNNFYNLQYRAGNRRSVCERNVNPVGDRRIKRSATLDESRVAVCGKQDLNSPGKITKPLNARESIKQY